MSKTHPHPPSPSAMTSPAQLERLGEHLRKLRLPGVNYLELSATTIVSGAVGR